MPIRQVVNRSTHERMISGDSYSLKAISIITGIHHNTLHGRLRGKDELTDHELRTIDLSKCNPERRRRSGVPSNIKRLETKADELSSQFLRGKL
jgi:hypothetical protein